MNSHTANRIYDCFVLFGSGFVALIGVKHLNTRHKDLAIKSSSSRTALILAIQHAPDPRSTSGSVWQDKASYLLGPRASRPQLSAQRKNRVALVTCWEIKKIDGTRAILRAQIS